MKFADTTQAARLNAEFASLSDHGKETVLRLVAQARRTSGMQAEGPAFAYRRSGDNKVAWGIKFSGDVIKRGVFPE